MNYIIISMYTPDEVYFEAQKKLVESLNQFKLFYKIYEIEDKGNWHLNTNQKAETILKAMQEFPDLNIVWIDADALVKKKPTLFSRIKKDIGYYRLPNRNNELLSGTLFLKNSYDMQILVSSWINQNNSSELWEQKNLDSVLKNNPQISVFELPASYCKIFDNSFQKDAEDIIVHYQASRKLRNKIVDNNEHPEILVKKKIGNSTIKYKVKL